MPTLLPAPRSPPEPRAEFSPVLVVLAAALALALILSEAQTLDASLHLIPQSLLPTHHNGKTATHGQA